MTFPAHIIAQAREIAERHCLPWKWERAENLQAALCEALTTTPPSEEAMNTFNSAHNRDVKPAPEPTEDHLRRACEELGLVYDNAARMFKSVRTVARLLAELDALRHENDCLQHRVAQLDYPCSPHSDGYLREQKLARENADLRAERDAMQARVEEAEDNAWNEARELVRGTNADLCKTPGAAYRVIGEAMTNAVNNRNLRTLQGRVDALAKKRANSTPDPDLVLARKGAAQGEPSKINAECIRAGAGDGSAAVQSALRALKLARERGNG